MLLRDFATLTLGHPIHRIARQQEDAPAKRRHGRKKTAVTPEPVGEPVTVRVIGLSALQDGYVDHERLTISRLGSMPSETNMTRKDDVLVSLSRPFSAAYVGKDDADILIPSSCAIVRIPDERRDQWEPAFVAGYLSLPPVTRQLASQASGARSISISIATLGSLDIPVVPIATQQEIARKVTSHLEMVRLRRELDQLERSMVVSAYAAAFNTEER